MTKRASPSAARQRILDELARAGREHSDATVLFHATIASELELHPTDYKTLGILERLGPLSAGDIAQHSGLATASVTNLIDRLEQRGFVRRVRDAGDRRRVLVEPIRERLAAGRNVFASSVASLARLFEHYSDRDLSVIANFLARNAERLREETRLLSASSSSARAAQPAAAASSAGAGQRRAARSLKSS